MVKTSVQHSSNPPYCYPIAIDTLCVRLKIKRNTCTLVLVHYQNLYDHTSYLKTSEMKLILSDDLFDLYETTITMKSRHFKYYFDITCKNIIYHYTSDGFITEPEPSNYFYYSSINKDEIKTLPKNCEGEIIYQILVDRFFDGNPLNNPKNTKNKSELPDRNTYYGGDFEGIVQKLDYLDAYGVKIIYLSPVFDSPTYHKYDINDYYHIEDIYGGKEGLTTLVKKAHEKNMLIVLDTVFNHASSNHPFFQDILLNQEKSKYLDYFEIESFPVSVEKGNYNNFANLVPSMPKWNTVNPKVQNYLIDSSIYWMKKCHIDGFRLDVADEVSHAFWKNFYLRIKQQNKDAIIIGEIWNQAQNWVNTNEIDTVTDYKFRQFLLDFSGFKKSSTHFFQKLNHHKMLYLTPTFNYLVHLVGSHDTIRLINYLQKPKFHFLTLSTMLLFDGIPLIYYGDEIALPGEVDPDNRRAMIWDRPITSEEEAFKKLCKFRSQSEVLKKGTLETISSTSRVLKFIRSYQNHKILVVINFSGRPTLVVSHDYIHLLGEVLQKNGGFIVYPYSYALFRI
ncbi:MAG: glycoside hydrolase family 13 protein [Candidatus Izemoplasmatales bacterium]|nr:glycoside hydrolase family 13 protein [Candidatus Izemoplasmatales bacterium]